MSKPQIKFTLSHVFQLLTIAIVCTAAAAGFFGSMLEGVTRMSLAALATVTIAALAMAPIGIAVFGRRGVTEFLLGALNDDSEPEPFQFSLVSLLALMFATALALGMFKIGFQPKLAIAILIAYGVIVSLGLRSFHVRQL